jgi:cbb3-type cytochrome oxidase subunit 3
VTHPVPVAEGAPEPKRDLIERLPKALRTTNTLFFLLIVIAGVASAYRTANASQFATALEWMLASLLSGAAVGFLFGIPKILQGDVSRAKTAEGAAEVDDGRQGYRQQVNTNLTEISDWLTKIIVGLGLIHLEKVPGHLRAAGKLVAAGMSANPGTGDEAFGIALIVFHATLGFLFGYISTRLFLAGAFSDADQAWEREQRRQIATNQTALASLTSTTDVLKHAVFPNRTDAPTANAAPAGVDGGAGQGQLVGSEEVAKALIAQANAYLAIGISDYAARVAAKDQAADRMAKLVLDSKMSSEELAELARNERNEGLVVALATVINTSPQPGDFARLMSVASGVTRLHVKYRVLVAASQLVRKRLVTKDDVARLQALLMEYEQGADGSLRQLISSTRSAL